MSGLRKAVLVATASLVLLTTGAGVADASSTPPVPDPTGLVKTLTDTVQQVTKPVQQALPAAPASSTPAATTPSTGSTPSPDSQGISQPKAPDHSSSHVLHGEVLPGQTGSTPASAEAGSGTSTINDDNSSNADASLLAVGGMTLYGSQASSSGANDGHGMAEPVCSSSGTAVCPLQADSHATETSTASDSSTKTSVLSLCLAAPSGLAIPIPTGASTSADCPTGIGIDAISSHSTMHRDKTTGETSGSTDSSLANLCLPGAQLVSDSCVGAVSSQGSADSNGTVTRSSSVLNLFGQTGDTPLTAPAGTPDALCKPSLPASGLPFLPIPLPLPQGATTGLCGFINQGQTYLGSDLAAVSQTALSGDLFGLASLDAGHSEVLAHQVPVTAQVSPPVTTTQPPATTTTATTPAVHHTTSVVHAVAGVLPHTGGIWSGWLAIGLLMLAAGSALAARDLRRGRVTG